MNGAKICQQQIWGSTNYQMTSYFGATTPTLPRFIQATSIVHFQLEDFEFITNLAEQLSNFEFVQRPVESNLSVCSML